MDVRSHPCESNKRHCSAGAGPDRLEKGVAWVDLLDDRDAWCALRNDGRICERVVRKRIKNMRGGVE